MNHYHRTMHVRSTKVLLELDEGLLSLVDAEAAGGTRLAMLRTLVLEGLEARARDRGEELPRIEPWTSEQAPAQAADPDPWPGIQAHRRDYIQATKLLSAPGYYSAPPIGENASLGGDIISVSLIAENGTVIRSRPVRTAHESVTAPNSVTAGDAQTPSEVRIEGLKK